MSKDYVRKLLPIRDLNNPHFCVWLEEMAEQGLLFQSISLGANFKKSEPQKRRYRPIYKKLTKMSEEEKAFYEDAGWHLIYIGSMNNLTIATTADENAPEIFNDDESYKKSLRHKWIGYLATVLSWFVLMYIWYRLTIGTVVDGGSYGDAVGKLHALNEDYSGRFIPVAVIVGIIILVTYLMMLVEDVGMLKFMLGAKRPVFDRNNKYRTALKMNRVRNVFLCLLIIATIGLLCYTPNAATNTNDGAAALKYDGEHPVRFSDFDPDTWTEVKPLIEKMEGETAEDIEYTSGSERGKYIKHGYLERVTTWKVLENEMADDIAELNYYSYYGEAKDAEVALQWIGEEATFDIYDDVAGNDTAKVLDEIKIDCDGVDYAGYTTTECEENVDYDYQHLYLQKGDMIEIVLYLGPINLKDKIGLFVEEMK